MPDLTEAGVLAINALIPIVVPFVVWGAKSLIPKIPKSVLPALAVVAGMGLDQFLGFVGGGSWGLLAGAGLGALGVFAREVVHTLKNHGVTEA